MDKLLLCSFRQMIIHTFDERMVIPGYDVSQETRNIFAALTIIE